MPIREISSRGRFLIWWALGVARLASFQAMAQNYGETGTVLAEAAVTTSPPAIDLHWPLRTDVTGYRLSIRKPDQTETSQNLSGFSTGYHDADVTPGGGYEYRIRAARTLGSSPSYAYANLYAGVDLGVVENRGRVILVADQRVAPALNPELARWEQDVSSSGWAVERVPVAEGMLPTDIRNAIRAKVAAWPLGTEGAVFLFGHVPVPYSGNIYPDGHVEHRGAWPCDAFYGELDSQWSDNVVNNVAAVRPENHNVSADRKFDPSTLPSAIELMVGRLDFWDLPAFGESETELLRRYLNKEHAFRAGQLSVERRAVVDDNFATVLTEAPSVSARFTMAGMVGAGSISSTDDFTSDTQSHSALMGLAAGYGDYQAISNACSTTQCVTAPPQVLFSLVFGSYFGDFDTQNNVMRSILAADNCALAAGWSGRPQWQMHHLAMNFPLGFAVRLTQNTTSSAYYNPGLFLKSTHLALMGDPTLTLFNSESAANVNEAGGTLTWTPPVAATLQGFHVYRSATPTGPWERQNPALLPVPSWTDPAPVAGSHYLVRAVHRETTASGTFLNASMGALANPPSETVSLRVVEPTAREYPLQPAVIRVERIGHGAALEVILMPPGGTGVEGEDFAALPATVTIPEGASFADLAVQPLVDEEREGTETVTVAILSAGGAMVDPIRSSVSVEIVDHPWQDWCRANFPALRSKSSSAASYDDSPEGDADLDGLSNLMEFALGTNPLQANNESVLSTVPAAGNVCITSYNRAIGKVGLDWGIETSKDFVTWTPSPPNVTETITPGPGDTEHCEVRLPMTEKRNFLRLTLTSLPGFFP